ncbi:MAG: hypothetical protein H7263_16780 [Candidatus Sericytochromatia bacterium]|nr:hypothetical protein [Candidatus Sericytochromatia bacterium]
MKKLFKDKIGNAKLNLALSISSLIFLSTFTACSSNSIPSTAHIQTSTNLSSFNKVSSTLLKTEQNESNLITDTKNENIFIADLGKGVTTSSTISVKLDFLKGKGFKLKGSTAGQAPKTKTDIKLIRFYLVDSNASSLGNTNIQSSSFDITGSSTGTLGTLFTNLTNTGGTGTIKFINVSSGSYYVAAAAYSSTTTINSTTNINNLNTLPAGNSTNINLTSPSTINLGRFSLSNSGGDAPGLSGLVTVGSSYNLINNGTATLGLSLNLADSVGASIETDVTFIDGANSPSGTIGVM